MSTSGESESAIRKYFKEFSVLRETRREYWGIQAINFLDSTMFFTILTMAPLMLSQNFGFSDEAAGWVMTVYGSGTTICLFFLGMVTDWLGIRRSFYVAQLGQLVTRGAVLILPYVADPTGTAANITLWVCFALQAPFVAMVQTSFQAANKRFTTARSRSAGFNAWYIFMNVGAFAAGFVIDLIRVYMKDWMGLDVPPNHFMMGFAVAACLANLLLTVVYVRREEQLYGPDEKPAAAPAQSSEKKGLFAIAGDVLREKVFWRFLVLVTLLLGVRAVFLHMHLIMPKFWERVIGEGARIGALEQINPAGVIIGLFLFIPILKRFTTYGMLTWGSLISALSLFILAIPGTGNTIYITSAMALIVLTIGEVIWSPRLTEYTAAIAPEGQEGTYLGLSMVPYFAAKTAVSALSGYMLAFWVPLHEEGPTLIERLEGGTIPFWRTPWMMWIILGVWAISGPILALLLRGWFTKGAKWEKAEEKRDDAIQDAPPEAPEEPQPEA